MKKLIALIAIFMTAVLTGCSSKPPVPEHPVPTATAGPQIYFIQQPAAAPQVIQQPVYVGRPMYAPYNAFIPVPGQPPRVNSNGYYYQ